MQEGIVELSDGTFVNLSAETAAMSEDEINAKLSAAGMAPLKSSVSANTSEDKSLMQSAKDFITAKNRNPEIPSIRDAFNAPDHRAAQMQMLMNFLPMGDEKRKGAILNIEPKATFSTDASGNLVTTFPNRSDAGKGDIIEGQGTTFYPNPTGLDMTDISQVASTAGMAPLVARGLQGIGLPTTGLTGSSLIGATEAGLLEGVNTKLSGMGGEKAGVETPPYRMGVIPEGGAFGAAGDLVGKIAFTLARRAKNLYSSVFDDSGQLNNSTKKAIGEMNLNPSEVRAETIKVLQRDRSPAPTTEKFTSAQAGSLPVAVPLSKGNITENPMDQLFEDAAAKGVYGDQAQKNMVELKDAQDAALKENLQEIQNTIASNPTGAIRPENVIQRNAGAQMAQDELGALRTKMDARSDRLYQIARDPKNTVNINAETGNIMTGNLTDRFQQGFSGNSAPNVLADLQDFVKNTNPTLRDMYEFRAKLRAYGTDITPNGAAANALIKTFDDTIESVQDTLISSGNTNAVKAWKNAISGYKEFMDIFDNKKIMGKLTKTDPNGEFLIDPSNAADQIFGLNASGFASKRDLVKNIKALKKTLNPETFDALRQEAWIKLTDLGQKGDNPFSGKVFNTAWRDMVRKDNGILRELFTSEERKLITQFGSVAERVTSGAKNYSNTGVLGMGLIQQIWARLGGTNAAISMAGVRTIPEFLGSIKAQRAAKYNPKMVPTTGGTALRSGSKVGVTLQNEDENQAFINSLTGGQGYSASR